MMCTLTSYCVKKKWKWNTQIKFATWMKLILIFVIYVSLLTRDPTGHAQHKHTDKPLTSELEDQLAVP